MTVSTPNGKSPDNPTGAAPAGQFQWDCTNWDLNAQQPHGGQEWSSIENFVEDFSVTTNFAGPPWKAVACASASLQHMDHYPAANFEPAITDLSRFLSVSCAKSAECRASFTKPNCKNPDTYSTPESKSIHSRMILGNGASELIDLVTRIAAPSGGCRLGAKTQYKEYERAAVADGRRTMVNFDSRSSGSKVKVEEGCGVEGGATNWTILAIINPCNPTGEYRDIEQLKAYIESAVKARKEGDTREGGSESVPEHGKSPTARSHTRSVVLVDESMQPWRGEQWREDSLVSQPEWVLKMFEDHGCSVYVIHSWTKIWSCPGIRLGSILCPTQQHCLELKKHQVPWSLNIAALAFLSAAVDDKEYLRQTWELTVSWRKQTEDKINKLFPNWEILGEKWLSWLWIDTGSVEDAAEAVRLCKLAGTPIRNGAMGYELPTFVRMAVRSPDSQAILFEALKGMAQRKNQVQILT